MSGYVRRVTQLERPIHSRLPTLDIELTERCNNSCIHCCINLPAGDSQARTREMSAHMVKDVLMQATTLGCRQVRLTGGEPLLRPDFEEIYLFARRLGLKVHIFTNACLITTRLANLLARVPPLVSVEVSSYGMSATSYEAVTQTRGSFHRFRTGVTRLLERKVPFVVKGALLPPNRNELDEFELWAATIPWMTKRPDLAMFFDLRNRRDSEEKNDIIRSLRISAQEGLVMLARDEVRYRSEMNEFASKFMGPPGSRLFRCGAGQSVCVDAYGYVQPCMGIRAPDRVVDMATASLAEALDSFASLRDLHATNPHYLERCAKCILHGFCEQCPAKAWSEHGTLDTPVEYLCDLAHAQARWLGWLGEGAWAWEAKNWKRR